MELRHIRAARRRYASLPISLRDAMRIALHRRESNIRVMQKLDGHLSGITKNKLRTD
jgi:hypothetical protein